MATKIMMMIPSNKNPVKQIGQVSLPSNRTIMTIRSNKFTVTKNNQNNQNKNNQALAMNLAQINKTKGCGCGGGGK